MKPNADLGLCCGRKGTQQVVSAVVMLFYQIVRYTNGFLWAPRKKILKTYIFVFSNLNPPSPYVTLDALKRRCSVITILKQNTKCK